MSTKGRLKKEVTVPEVITLMGKITTAYFLLIRSLGLRNIFRSSIFPQAHKKVNSIETHFDSIQLNYKAAAHKREFDMHLKFNIYY
jgi:hypothetical protein